MDEIAATVGNPAVEDRVGHIAQDVAFCADKVIATDGTDETQEETLGFEEERGLSGET